MLYPTVHAGTVEAGSEDVAVAGGDSMAGLEAAAAQLGTRLPGFVSAGVQGGQQPAQGQQQAQQPKGLGFYKRSIASPVISKYTEPLLLILLCSCLPEQLHTT